MSRAFADVDLGAISRNCAALIQAAAPAQLCAVVKADGYGHGMAEAAAAAQAGGASWLAVAAAEEGLALRAADVTGPVLVMGAIERDEVQALVDARCDLTVWSEDALDWAEQATGPARVHVKLDSGMGRLGTRSQSEAVALARRAGEAAGVDLIGLTTHFATADDHGDGGFLERQNEVFSAFADSVRSFAPDVIVHAANSAATLRLPAARHDMVRCGIGIYGLDPFHADPSASGLEPALAFSTWIASIKACEAGQSVGYGRGFTAETATRIATCPVGYADGVRRLVGGRVDCLVGGERYPIVGRVSMDNIAIDIGPDGPQRVGDRVVLIGRDGDQRILAEEWASAAETINYEIATGIGGRTLRRHVRG